MTVPLRTSPSKRQKIARGADELQAATTRPGAGTQLQRGMRDGAQVQRRKSEEPRSTAPWKQPQRQAAQSATDNQRVRDAYDAHVFDALRRHCDHVNQPLSFVLVRLIVCVCV